MRNQLNLKFNASAAAPLRRPAAAPDLSRVSELTEGDKTEALGFLSVRPVHTVVMTSFILDNGMVSSLNRGKFYGYRNSSGTLEGIALIGHTTLVECRSDAATEALAFAARHALDAIHIVMSSGDAARDFWTHYSGGAFQPRLTCVEKLFELAYPVRVPEPVAGLRKATQDELIQVAEAQAEIAFVECGKDPMTADRKGFLSRVSRRIGQGRVFVVVDDNGKLVFKADVISETDTTAYLEGVWVTPDRRGNGVASKCLANLSIELLKKFDNVCLLSNVEFEGAHRCFSRAGFRNTDECTTLFA